MVDTYIYVFKIGKHIMNDQYTIHVHTHDLSTDINIYLIVNYFYSSQKRKRIHVQDVPQWQRIHHTYSWCSKQWFVIAQLDDRMNEPFQRHICIYISLSYHYIICQYLPYCKTLLRYDNTEHIHVLFACSCYSQYDVHIELLRI